jgi:hypothetical protein
MAGAQEEFGNRLGEGYMANLGMSLLTSWSLYMLIKSRARTIDSVGIQIPTKEARI